MSVRNLGEIISKEMLYRIYIGHLLMRTDVNSIASLQSYSVTHSAMMSTVTSPQSHSVTYSAI